VALTVFKTVRDLTTSGWVGSIPMHSRQRSASFHGASDDESLSRRGRFVRLLIKSLLLSVALAAPAFAQRIDTLNVSMKSSADSVRSPITPRRAFFYSFMLPGYSQSVLGRYKSATAFLLVEGISLVMIRESGADKHEARRLANDTLILSYVDGAGNAGKITAPPTFNNGYVRTRAAHVEDWIALLVANHLFAGADAFVAANLWDVPSHISLRVAPNRTTVGASFKW
jgi:hypothetical protein